MTPDLVKKILVDVFEALINLNRNKKKDVKLQFQKNFSSLYLNRAGELSFDKEFDLALTEPTLGDDHDRVQSFRPRNKIREDGVSVLD